MAGTLTVQTLQGPSSGVNANKIIIPSGQTLDASGGGMTLPTGVGGKILQVQSTTTDDQTAYTTNNWTTMTGLTVDITPSSTSSKIYLQIMIYIGNTNDDNYNQFRGQRTVGGTTTTLATGKAVGNATLVSWANNGPYTHAQYEVHASGWNYLDSPATTSAITYSVSARAMHSTNRTMYLNRPANTTDGNRSACVSTITAWEIAG